MLKTSGPRPPAAAGTYDVRRMFGEAAQRYPASPALRRGRLELTYGELDLASDRVGAALREQGAGQG
ncbi:MAG TPA: hypothetical protein VHG32_16070, partial [Thermoanaerobaculia bacterium]|nr:hypothetical protein [Thermoanaerobaculia bacterium]